MLTEGPLYELSAAGSDRPGLDLGWRDPLLGIEPAFADVHDDPVFQAQVARMIELINIERAKLDMEPVELT